MEFEVALQYNEGYQESISALPTTSIYRSGTHLSGFKSGLTKTVNTYIKNADLLKNEKVAPQARTSAKVLPLLCR
jgi:DNA gyrase subunit B